MAWKLNPRGLQSAPSWHGTFVARNLPGVTSPFLVLPPSNRVVADQRADRLVDRFLGRPVRLPRGQRGITDRWAVGSSQPDEIATRRIKGLTQEAWIGRAHGDEGAKIEPNRPPRHVQ